MRLSKVCYISIFAIFFLTAVQIAYAVKPKDKPPVAEDIEERLERLEALVLRLHGNKAAVFERGGSGSRSGDVNVQSRIILSFCPAGTLPPLGDCESVPEALILMTEFLEPSDAGSVITFDKSNSTDFQIIADLLTNGDGDDVIKIALESCVGASCGEGSGTNTELFLFFYRDHVTTGTGYVDLEGLEIGSISVSLDRFSSFYNSGDDLTEFSIDYRVFFELAD